MNARTAFLTAALAASLAGPLAAEDTRPTASFRSAHAEIQEHLGHLEGMAGSLAAKDAEGRRRTAAFIVTFLTEHILEHAGWEEKHLYPAVDARTHAGDHPFTGTMRYEHKIVGRWIVALKTAAAKPELDATAFARSTDRLLGLISAHFEEEEEVLLPVLDRTMTRAQVEQELGSGAAHHTSPPSGSPAH